MAESKMAGAIWGRQITGVQPVVTVWTSFLLASKNAAILIKARRSGRVAKHPFSRTLSRRAAEGGAKIPTIGALLTNLFRNPRVGVAPPPPAAASPDD